MTLADAIQAELPNLRREAEGRMLDTFACRYRGAGTTQDETTGREIPTWPTRFSTPGRLTSRSGTPGTRTVEVAGVQVAQASLELHLPISAPLVSQGDVFECLTAADDLQLVGLVYRVVGPAAASQKTARRLDVVEVAAPWT